MVDGTTARRLAWWAEEVPAGWCVSTIARLAVNDPGSLAGAAGCQAALRVAGPAPAYPAESLHVSLLGATQRETSPDFAPHRLRAIAAAARTTAASIPAAAARQGRLNLLGTQWFVEVTPADSTCAALRRALAARFEALGEAPIAYADTEPVHLNVTRLDRLDDPASADALLADPPDLDRTATLRSVEVDLLSRGVPATDVAQWTGYADQPHLTRSLRRYVGQTPAQVSSSVGRRG